MAKAKQARRIENRVEGCPTLPWAELRGWDFNALKDDTRDVAKLKAAIVAEGFCFPLLVWEPGCYVFDGTGRRQALDELTAEGYELDPIPVVKVRAEDLDGAKRLALMASSQHGKVTQRSFDLFVGSFEFYQLELMAPLISFEGVNITVRGGQGDGGQGYTQKIVAPIYVPTGDPPAISELVDRTKADQLIQVIKAAKLPAPTRNFLLHAAERHVAFRYDLIANYYAHAPAPIKDLMEASMLVVVDFKRALADGFVRLNQDVDEAFHQDYPDA